MWSRNLAFIGAALALLFVLPPVSTSLAGTADRESLYVGPAINRDVFKEGAVRRIEASFQNWRVVCDEVTAERRRFCSLFGAGQTEGKMVGDIVVTTTREGQPAAMLHLPYGVSLRSGLTVAAASGGAIAGSRREKTSRVTKLAFVTCDAQGCMTLWPLTTVQLNALITGGMLIVRFKSMTVANMAGPTPILIGAADREMVISGLGFSEAVSASINNP